MRSILTVLVILLQAFCSAFAQQTRPPQDQVDSVLRDEFENGFPQYTYRGSEITAVLIPGTLEYQIEFKATLSSNRDICVKADPPQEVGEARTQLSAFEENVHRYRMLRQSIETKYEPELNPLFALRQSVSQDSSHLFFKIVQPANHEIIVYGKCLADRTVDLWRFSRIEVIQSYGKQEGDVAPADAIVLGTPSAASFERDIEAHMAAFKNAEDELSSILTRAEEEQRNIQDPIAHPVKKSEAPAEVLPFLAKFIDKAGEMSASERAQCFSDPVESFFGNGHWSRAQVEEYYASVWAGAVTLIFEADLSAARIYVVEDGLRYFVQIPYHFNIRIFGMDRIGRALNLFVIRTSNGDPPSIESLDTQPLTLSSPFSAESLVLNEEDEKEREARKQEDSIAVSPQIAKDGQHPTPTDDDPDVHLRTQVQLFVIHCIESGESTDPITRNKFYAPFVEKFYDKRGCTREQILKSDEEYDRRWPIRSYRPLYDSGTVDSLGENTFRVTQPFDWTVSNGKRTLTGTSIEACVVTIDSGGGMEIEDIDETRVR